MAQIKTLHSRFEKATLQRRDSSDGIFRALSAPDFHESFERINALILDLQYKKTAIDINQREPLTGFTPLHCAVSLCERIFHVYGPDRTAMPTNIDLLLHMRLKNLELIASAPGLLSTAQTPLGLTATDMAEHPETRTALYRGLNNPRKAKRDLLGFLNLSFRLIP
jgi:hypothetical protein